MSVLKLDTRHFIARELPGVIFTHSE